MAYYVCADLHGYALDRFRALLDKAGFSQNDFLYVLGDVIDRGPDGVRLLTWLIDMPNAQLLQGNHEAMMLGCDFLFDADTKANAGSLTSERLTRYAEWMANAGIATVEALSALPADEVQRILDALRQAPLYAALTVNGRKFILTHAGLGHFRKRRKLSAYAPEDLLWTRPALRQTYYRDATVIFGHTPTWYYGKAYEGKSIVTPTWINIDVGAGYGFKPLLLRLDDMREFYADA